MTSFSARARWFFVCLFVLAGTPIVRLGAQQPATQIPPPTIRVSTRLVLVDAVVTDKKGQPVTGLKPEDFVIEENGKKQKIAAFSTPQEGANAPAPTLPPGIYSNRPEYRSPGGPITVFVLDAANTPFRDQAYARLQMLKYVEEQNKSKQRVAIFALTNRLQMLQDFTSDPQVLTAALNRYKPQEPILAAGGPPPMTAASGDTGRASAQAIAMATAQIESFQSVQVAYALDRRTETTLEGMRTLARVLGGMPGRKEVIWLTAAFPFDLIPEDRNVSEAEEAALQQGIRQMGLGTRASSSTAERQRMSHGDEIRAAAAQMSSAQVAIYPVDVRGLVSGIELTIDDSANRQPLNTSERALVRMSDVTASQETMREIASQTGGKACVNQNEVKDGIAIALADNVASYTIGYYPEDKKWNGNFRNIKVKVDRDGAQVRHRKGYFALDPTQLKDRKPDQEIAEALGDAIPATMVGFSARVKPTDKGKLGIDFLVDAHTITAADASGGGKKLNVSFYAAVFGPDGKMMTNRSMKVDQAFNADNYQQILQHGMLLHMDLDPQPANSRLRLAVRDEPTGYIGTTQVSVAAK